MITFGSLQPDQLEVVVHAAPSGTRACPVSLNDATWMTTDSASSTNTPPTIGRSSSCLIRIATVPSARAERQRPDVAHEDFGRVRVLPEEAERRADERAAEHRELRTPAKVHEQQVVREDAMAGDVRERGVRRGRDRERC